MKVAILGAGMEGLSLASHFLKQGAQVAICDYRKQPRGSKGNQPRGLVFQTGKDYLKNLEKYDIIFRSPGIPFLTKEIQGLIKKGKKISSLTKYFFENCKAKIIGVTGTKGKGTVATLLFRILKNARSSSLAGNVFFGGNIGISPLEFLEKLKQDDLVILELSSFQLQDLRKSPHIAVILGITEDHLDHHKTFAEYVGAKQNIVKFQTANDIVIADIDNEVSRRFLDLTPAQKYKTSLVKKVKQGGFLKSNTLYITNSGRPAGVIKIDKIKIPGRHNILNILMASVAAFCIGAPVKIIAETIEGFKGLEHRLEFVCKKNGVEFYNDSASTNPDTCIAALRSFQKPMILIAGGSKKFVSYDKLGKEIIKNLNVKKIVLIGQTAKEIEEAVLKAAKSSPEIRKKAPLELISADSAEEAFLVAKMSAKQGDTVLLSPASASFDMFKNYQERGRVFKKFIKFS